jgi:hypothetical protein
MLGGTWTRPWSDARAISRASNGFPPLARATPALIGGDAAQRETEAADARLVQPLQVVDEECDRLGFAQPRQQAPDRQGNGQGVDLAARGFGALQGDGERALLRAREGLLRSLGEPAEQFGEPREGQSLLELRRSNGEHPSPLAPRLVGGGLQQDALADPGSPTVITLRHGP